MVFIRFRSTRNLPASRLTRVRKPTSKELDLLLLASCSCLMTMLYHPVAEALQSSQIGNGAASAIATHTSQTAPTTMNSFHLIALSARDEAKEEEEN